MAEIRPAHLTDASDLDAYHEVLSQLHAEAWPHNPPRSKEELRLEVENTPGFVTIVQWLAWEGGEPVALMRLRWRESEDNRDLAAGYLGVVPSHRRRRIASDLIGVATRAALDAGRTKLIMDSDSMAPAGAEALERLGGKKGITVRISRMDIDALDLGLMDAWLAEGERLTDEFELLFFGPEPVPPEHKEAFAELHHVMNSAPFEDLDVEPFVLTVEQMEAYEVARAARGIDWWATIVRHRESGEFAGFTELQALPEDRSIIYQGDTGVWHKYRGRGLGRWVKAANLLRVLPLMPNARWVETGNAGSNRPMLSINEAMGFYPYKQIIGWQFDTAALQARVKNSVPAA